MSTDQFIPIFNIIFLHRPTVVYYKDKTDVTKIEKAISDIGYQANDVLANSVTYEGLPACCKIGGMDKI